MKTLHTGSKLNGEYIEVVVVCVEMSSVNVDRPLTDDQITKIQPVYLECEHNMTRTVEMLI